MKVRIDGYEDFGALYGARPGGIVKRQPIGYWTTRTKLGEIRYAVVIVLGMPWLVRGDTPGALMRPFLTMNPKERPECLADLEDPDLGAPAEVVSEIQRVLRLRFLSGHIPQYSDRHASEPAA